MSVMQLICVALFFLLFSLFRRLKTKDTDISLYDNL